MRVRADNLKHTNQSPMWTTQVIHSRQPWSEAGMNRKQISDQSQYRMNYYPGGVGTPVGYAMAVADKPGLYATSPYATIPSPYASSQPGLTPSIQHYAALRQPYAMVSQATPYPSTQHAAAAAYYASPTATAYGAPTAVPLSSLQTMSTSTQSPYLGTQYATGIGVQGAMLRPTSVAAGGYGGSPLYAMGAYSSLPTVPGQPSRTQYAMGPVGLAAGASLPASASNPAHPSASTYGVSPYWALGGACVPCLVSVWFGCRTVVQCCLVFVVSVCLWSGCLCGSVSGLNLYPLHKESRCQWDVLVYERDGRVHCISDMMCYLLMCQLAVSCLWG